MHASLIELMGDAQRSAAFPPFPRIGSGRLLMCVFSPTQFEQVVNPSFRFRTLFFGHVDPLTDIPAPHNLSGEWEQRRMVAYITG